MNEKTNSVINTVPAASALHQVPLFDPLKLLRKTTSPKTGEKVLKFDLRYKKMWFRLVHPNGRMITRTLRLTDQMAIFEAQLFAERDDTTVLSQFTSCHTKNKSGPQYIRAAQDEALNEALDNAGFGIQLTDLVEGSDDSGYGSEILLSQVEALLRQPDDAPLPEQPVPAASASPVQKDIPVKSAPEKETSSTAQIISIHTGQQTPPAASDLHQNTVPASDVSTKPSVVEVIPCPAVSPVAAPVAERAAEPIVEPVSDTAADPVEEPVPVVTTAPAANDTSEPDAVIQPAESAPSASPETANLLQMLGTLGNNSVSVPEAEVSDPQPTETALTYTEDMTVEEIRQRITSEQAKSLVVTFGPNKGWTLGQVLERRPSSLRFYALVSTDASNAMKAGSLLLLDELKQMRAG